MVLTWSSVYCLCLGLYTLVMLVIKYGEAKRGFSLPDKMFYRLVYEGLLLSTLASIGFHLCYRVIGRQNIGLGLLAIVFIGYVVFRCMVLHKRLRSTVEEYRG